MTRISRTPTDDNDRPSGEKVASVIVNQAAALLTSRNCFDQLRFASFSKKPSWSSRFPTKLPRDGSTKPLKVASGFFTRWMARGLQ